MSLFARLSARLFGTPGAAAASGSPALIDPPELAARLAGPGAPLVIDVRGPDEFAGPLGHIAGAVNIPLPRLPERLAEAADAGRPVVLVCLSDRRSSMAAGQLRAAGVSDLSVLRGGMQAWRRLGMPSSA